MVYRVFVIKEVLVDADSWEDATEKALDGSDFICTDEYLDDERNGSDGGCEEGLE